MKIDGACHCGAIAYEAEIDPAAIIVCQCRDCQVLSGGAFRWGTLIPKQDFVLLRGAPVRYRKIADSGAARDLAFCGTCGTPLYGTEADQPLTYSLRLSSARQARELRPSHQIWASSALPWVCSLADLPEIAQPQSAASQEK
jgi:hypothetical protein